MSRPVPPRISFGTFTIADLRSFVFRAPIEKPVLASFGRMDSRPMVLVRIEDGDGAVGWGEIWCNFPSCGAEHRARLVSSVFSPLLVGTTIEDPSATFDLLSRRTRVLGLQTGEPGPLAQCIAGIDIALWDLTARRAGQPLWRLLGGDHSRIGVYASGLNPDAPATLAVQKQAEGYRAFKLKIGFGQDRDLANLRELRAALRDDAVLMVDANQAWDTAEAETAAVALAPFDLAWLEEPLAADTAWPVWRKLADNARVPLAAGENIAGAALFEAAIAASALAVVQPDIAKWGGFSGCLPVARRILAAGLRFCPHYLGGGWGQRAAAHLLAAAGGDGLLEIDANPNPLRTLLMGCVAGIADGACTLDKAPGLGTPPDTAALRDFSVAL